MTSTEIVELRKLLDQLTVASAIEASSAHVTGAEFENFIQLDDRVAEIAERIHKLLG